MQGILLDLDGVIYQDATPLPDAVQTLAWLRAEGIPHRFVTNTSSRPRQAIVTKLASMGMAIDGELLWTPPRVAQHWLATEVGGPVALLVTPATLEDFSTIERLADDAETGARAVVVGDLGDGWDYATLNRALRLLLDEAPPLLALGMTRFWQAADGLRLDVGAMVAALSYASGAEPVVLGKPSAAFFQAALDDMGLAAEQVLMIGDDIVSDVRGAQRAGLRGGLVRTGKFRAADLSSGIVPDVILEGIGALPGWWENHRRT